MENLGSSLPHLPDDIIIQILCKLPVKNLVRFCCVCKYWRQLITKDRGFIRSQLQNSVKNLSFFENALVSSDKSSKRCTCHKVSDLQPQKLTEKFAQASLNSPACRLIFRDGKFNVSGCCDGIICFFHRKCSRSDSKFMVYLCNPALRQCRTLPTSNYQVPRDSEVTVCFYFDPMSDDYKVLKIIHRRLGFMAEIYSLCSNSWEPFSLKTLTPSAHTVSGSWRPLVHNGLAYWLAWHVNDRGWRTLVLNVLDMAQENVVEVPIPNGIQGPHLELFQGSLSMFGWTSKIQFGIWVMKEDRTGITWIKQLRIPAFFIPLSCRTMGITASWEHLMATIQGNALLYDPKEQKVEIVNGVFPEGDLPHNYVVVDHVASLVSLIPPADEIIPRRKVIFSIFNKRVKKYNNKSERNYSHQLSFLSRMFACFSCKR